MTHRCTGMRSKNETKTSGLTRTSSSRFGPWFAGRAVRPHSMRGRMLVDWVADQTPTERTTLLIIRQLSEEGKVATAGAYRRTKRTDATLPKWSKWLAQSNCHMWQRIRLIFATRLIFFASDSTSRLVGDGHRGENSSSWIACTARTSLV